MNKEKKYFRPVSNVYPFERRRVGGKENTLHSDVLRPRPVRLCVPVHNIRLLREHNRRSTCIIHEGVYQYRSTSSTDWRIALQVHNTERTEELLQCVVAIMLLV